MSHGFEIRLDDLSGPEIVRLLEEHLSDMNATSPPESVHALDLDALKDSSISFWTVWHGKELAGCCALKVLNRDHGELKSMRTAKPYKNQGVASLVLSHVIEQAKQANIKRLSLETGTMSYFHPAHQLYKKHGFTECEPFDQYVEDPNSLFMTLSLA